jgi:hypothetical protein
MVVISQQYVEDEMCKMAQAVDYLDESYLTAKIDKIAAAITSGYPHPQILWAIHDFAQGCLDQLRFFRSHPEIPMPSPQPCEPFTPYVSTQLDGVKDIVSKQKKGAARKRQSSLA